ncbi:MAG: hypothetical protein AABY93_04580 [Bacteroidota bacterium]
MTEIINNKIDLKLILLFIPIAYGSYLFHEFGHWIVGEILGNDMSYSLNYVWPKSGQYIDSSHDLYVSTGGPAFTILLSLIFLLIIEKYRTIYAYPVVFFQFFCRFFSIVFGGFSKQDEARISVTVGLGTYTVAIVGLLILFLIVWRASHILKVNLKNNGYFFTISTVCQLVAIGTYEFVLKH